MSIHGHVLFKTQCPKCQQSGLDNSHDNLAVYEDGYSKCFACGHFEYDNKGVVKMEVEQKPKKIIPIIESVCGEITSRNLKKEICEHFSYGIGTFCDDTCQVADYKDGTGKTVAQKLRFKNKKFMWVGDSSLAGFYGQHLFESGKRLAITEGEIDCLSVAQAIGKTWPVVSLPSGASSAVKTCRDNIEWLSKFDEIVLFFDADEAGQKAIREVSELLPGRCKVAQYPKGFKDANDLLKAGREADIKSAYWNATDGYFDADVIEFADLEYEDIMTTPIKGYNLPFKELSNRIHGLRKRELVLVTAGSGIGKSTLVREFAYELVRTYNLKIGNIFLEESHSKTAQGYIAMDNNVSLGALRANPDLISREAFQESKEKIFVKSGMLALNHFGSMDCKKLIGKLEYLAVGRQVDFILLDHISMVVSGLESDNERKDIDMLMTALRSFIERTGVGVIAIVHLKRPQGGKSFNEGREVTLSDLRGSAALEQLTDTVIAAERNQQVEEEKHFIKFRILKCREFGEATGEAGYARYVPSTGRLVDSEGPGKDSNVPSSNPGFKDHTLLSRAQQPAVEKPKPDDSPLHELF